MAEETISRAEERLERLRSMVPRINVAIDVNQAVDQVRELQEFASNLSQNIESPQAQLEVFNEFVSSNQETFNKIPGARELASEINQGLQEGKDVSQQLDRLSGAMLTYAITSDSELAKSFLERGNLNAALLAISTENIGIFRRIHEGESAERVTQDYALSQIADSLGQQELAERLKNGELDNEEQRSVRTQLFRSLLRQAGYRQTERARLSKKMNERFEQNPTSALRFVAYLRMARETRRAEILSSRERTIWNSRFKQAFEEELNGNVQDIQQLTDKFKQELEQKRREIQYRTFRERFNIFSNSITEYRKHAEQLGLSGLASRLREIENQAREISRSRGREFIRKAQEIYRQSRPILEQTVERITFEQTRRRVSKIQDAYAKANVVLGDRAVRAGFTSDYARNRSRYFRRQFERFKKGEISQEQFRELLQREERRARAVNATVFMVRRVEQLRSAEVINAQQAQRLVDNLEKSLQKLAQVDIEADNFDRQMSAAKTQYNSAVFDLADWVLEVNKEAIGDSGQRGSASYTSAVLFRDNANALWGGRTGQGVVEAKTSSILQLTTTLSLLGLSAEAAGSLVGDYREKAVEYIRALRTGRNINEQRQEFFNAIEQAQLWGTVGEITAGLALTAINPWAGAGYFLTLGGYQAYQEYSRSGHVSGETALFLLLDAIPIARLGALRKAAQASGRTRQLLQNTGKILENIDRTAGIAFGAFAGGTALALVMHEQYGMASISGSMAALAFLDAIALGRRVARNSTIQHKITNIREQWTGIRESTLREEFRDTTIEDRRTTQIETRETQEKSRDEEYATTLIDTDAQTHRTRKDSSNTDEGLATTVLDRESLAHAPTRMSVEMQMASTVRSTDANRRQRVEESSSDRTSVGSRRARRNQEEIRQISEEAIRFLERTVEERFPETGEQLQEIYEEYVRISKGRRNIDRILEPALSSQDPRMRTLANMLSLMEQNRNNPEIIKNLLKDYPEHLREMVAAQRLRQWRNNSNTPQRREHDLDALEEFANRHNLNSERLVEIYNKHTDPHEARLAIFENLGIEISPSLRRKNEETALFFELLTRGELLNKIRSTEGFENVEIRNVEVLGGLRGIFRINLSNNRRVFLKIEDLAPVEFGAELCRAQGMIPPNVLGNYRYSPAEGIEQRWGLMEDIHDMQGKEVSIVVYDQGNMQRVRGRVESVALLRDETLGIRYRRINGEEIPMLEQSLIANNNVAANMFREMTRTEEGMTQILTAWKTYLRLSRGIALPDRFPRNTAVMVVNVNGRRYLTFQPIDVDGVGFRITQNGLVSFNWDFEEANKTFVLDQLSLYLGNDSRILAKVNSAEEVRRVDEAELPDNMQEIRTIIENHDGERIGIGFDVIKHEEKGESNRVITNHGSTGLVDRDGRVRLESNRLIYWIEKIRSENEF